MYSIFDMDFDTVSFELPKWNVSLRFSTGTIMLALIFSISVLPNFPVHQCGYLSRCGKSSHTLDGSCYTGTIFGLSTPDIGWFISVGSWLGKTPSQK